MEATALQAGLLSARIPFVLNAGQWNDPTVVYYADTMGGVATVHASGELTYYLAGSNRPDRTPAAADTPPAVTLRERLRGALPVTVKADEPAAATISFFSGNDRNAWRRGVAAFQTISLGVVYDGISARVTAHGGSVEKIFTVAPGANPLDIELELEGAGPLRVAPNGDLTASTAGGEVRFSAPVAYQDIAGQRVFVPALYWTDSRRYGFDVGDYDDRRPLIIDPILIATHVGTGSTDVPAAIALGADGAVYLAGYSQTNGAPTLGLEIGDSGYLSVIKMDAGLTSVLASARLGSRNAEATDIALDSAGNVYVTGYAGNGYPTTPGAYATNWQGASHASDGYDAIVTKLDGTLTNILASTYLGGGSWDYGYSLALDSAGNVFVTGVTSSTNFPTTAGAYDRNANGLFVSKFDAHLSALLASTCVGGTNTTEEGHAIAVDAYNRVYVTGAAYGSNFPVTAGAYDPTYNGGDSDVMIVRLDNGLTALQASTVLGGGGEDYAKALTLDANGRVFVAGVTESTNFPTGIGAYKGTFNGYSDAFVCRLDADLRSLDASTYLGGSMMDLAYGLALDPSGYVYVVGATESYSFPTTAGEPNQYTSVTDDVYVAKFNPDLTRLAAAARFGGTGFDWGRAAVADSSGGVYVVGYTGSTNFPTTTGAASRGSYDGFVARAWMTNIYAVAVTSVYRLAADFDGDRKADPAMVSNGLWTVWLSGSNYNRSTLLTSGLTTATPIWGDFDANNRADIAMVSNGNWHVWLNADAGMTHAGAYSFAVSGAVPLAGDFDGDGRDDPIMIAEGAWTLWLSSLGYAAAGPYTLVSGVLTGWMADDFDGDDIADPALNSTGNWYVWFSSAGYARGGPYALALTDTPMLAADFDGDGFADPAIAYSDREWYVWFSGLGYTYSAFYRLSLP